MNRWDDYPRSVGMSNGARAVWIGGAGLLHALVIGALVALGVALVRGCS